MKSINNLLKIRITIVLFLIGSQLLGCGFATPLTDQQRYDRSIDKLNKSKNEQQRFHALDQVAKTSFNIGRVEEARETSRELLTLAPKFIDDWNFGNAIYDGNMVLGRIAVKGDNISEAEAFLLKAGESIGSPTLNSFGPNMSLAKDLLERGHKDVVLRFLELCRVWWKDGNAKIDIWEKEINTGKTPHFGANLKY